MKQFDELKSHLLGSFRELLLALSSSFEILDKVSGDSKNIHVQSFQDIFQKLDLILRNAAEGLSGQDEQEQNISNNSYKSEVLQSIVDILDSEIETVSENQPNNFMLKVEALQSIKAVLLKNMDRVDSLFEEVEAVKMEKKTSQI